MVATWDGLLASPRHSRHLTSKEKDMTASTATARQPRAGTPQPIDLAAVKARQRAAWSSGDSVTQ
jgi:hypothetical protein